MLQFLDHYEFGKRWRGDEIFLEKYIKRIHYQLIHSNRYQSNKWIAGHQD